MKIPNLILLQKKSSKLLKKDNDNDNENTKSNIAPEEIKQIVKEG